MDPVLAELYNTMEPVEISEEEIQKTAQLQLLQKLAEDANIKLEDLSDEQIMEAYAALQDVPQEKTAAEQTPEAPITKEAEEMFQNADTMGRIVAHAYVDELKQIQKQAMIKEAMEEEEKEEKKEEKKENPLLAAIKAKKENGEEKEKSAFDKAVEDRAIEMLKQAGAVREDGSIMTPDEYKAFVKQAEQGGDPEAVDRAALQTLEQMGFPVTWSE
jgi:hypothetical protein